MTTTDRRAALEHGVCPEHGLALEEVTDVDEHGPWITFACAVGCRFGSLHNPVMGYAPVDTEPDAPLDQQLRAAGAPCLPGFETTPTPARGSGAETST